MNMIGLLRRGPWILVGALLVSLISTGAVPQEAKDLTGVGKEPIVVVQQAAGEQPSSAFVPPAPEVKKVSPEEEQKKLFEEQVLNKPLPCTLNFKDSELQNVMRMLREKTNINIMMPKKSVTGIVTLYLENVTIAQALDSILKTYDLAYVIEPGNIVRIVPRSQVRAEAVELRTLHRPLNWVEAAELEKTISPFKSTRYGKIKADPVSNSLIIIDTPEKIVELERLIDTLDAPEKQVMIEARMVDMTEEAGRSLGIRWGIWRPDSDNVSPATTSQISGQPYQEVLRSEPGIGYRPVYDSTGNQVQVPDPNNPGSLIGLNEPFVTGLEEVVRNVRADDLSAVLGQWTGRGALMQLGEVLHVFGSDYNLEMALDAYENENLITVLANPRVITINNVPANIEIKSKIPYLEAVQGPSGQFITNEVEFEESSVKIKVTPNITNNGFVKMKVEPEQKIYRGRYLGVPIIDERRAQTNVIVKDEATVVIGGLREHDRSKDTEAIPWVNRIPVLGWLFKSRLYADAKKELVLFVTPHILKEPALTEKEKNYYDKIDASWKLPDYFYDEVPQKEIQEDEAPEKK